MKVQIKKNNDLLRIVPNGIRLINITEDGYYHYKVTLEFELNEILKRNAYRVVIAARSKSYEKETIRVFGSFNSRAIVAGLRTQKGETFDLSKKVKDDGFFQQELDLTSKIPKNVLGKIRREVFQAIELKKFVYKPVSVLDATSKNLDFPILDNNVTSFGADKTSSNFEIRQAANNLLYGNKVDPAQKTSITTGNLLSTKLSTSGTQSKKQKTANNLTKFLTQGTKDTMIGSLLNTKNVSNLLQLKPNDVVMMPTETTTTFAEGTFDVYIPTGDLTDDQFYFTLFHYDKSNVVLGLYNYFVPHLLNIENLEIPTTAPVIEVAPTTRNSFVSLGLKQIDSTATQIYLYRKTIQKSSSQDQSIFVEVGRYSVQKGEDFVRVEDVLPSLSPTIYRSVAVSKNGIMGADFSSAFVDISAPGTPKASKNFRPDFVSIEASATNSGITVEIRDIPMGPISWGVVRKNLTTNEKTHKLISDLFSIRDESASVLSFEDINVSQNRIYDYKILMIYKDGHKQLSSNSSIANFKPVQTSTVNTKILSANAVQVGNDYDVVFRMETEVLPGNLDYIKQSLINQGLTEYADAIQTDRSQLQKLFAYQIDRFNMTTGESESFGTVNTQDFSDLKIGSNKSVQAVLPGNRYEYKVTTHLRSADSLISSITTTVSGSTGTYQYKPSKWLHPIALNQGTLTTPASRRRNFAQSDFTFGEVADVSTVSISLADTIPVLENVKASKMDSDKVLVNWNVKGNLKKVDHFIVILEILGMRTVVGKSHAFGSSSNFRFLDELTDGERGALTYFVVPVYADQTRGDEQKTNTVIVE